MAGLTCSSCVVQCLNFSFTAVLSSAPQLRFRASLHQLSSAKMDSLASLQDSTHLPIGSTVALRSLCSAITLAPSFLRFHLDLSSTWFLHGLPGLWMRFSPPSLQPFIPSAPPGSSFPLVPPWSSLPLVSPRPARPPSPLSLESAA